MRRLWLGLALAALLLPVGAERAGAQDPQANVLIYSGTTGYRHGGPGEAIQPAVVQQIQQRLAAAGIDSDYRTCNGEGTGAGAVPGCRNPEVGNPAIFTSQNLAQYDAIFFWQASSRHRQDTTGQRLFTAGEQDAIEGFVHAGGGVAAMHASVTMGAGQVTWPWWDAPGDSAIGALMPGHSATDANNVATVQVADHQHPSTRELPDTYEFGDEHYTFSSNVRGTHHVLMTLDEESYNVGAGVTRMGADHPIAWCRMYEGGRIWTSSLGHFSAAYLENGGDNNLMKHLVGGVAWVAGTAGNDGDCGGTVWSNFRRTVLAEDVNGAIGLDVAPDGKVYWTEIGVQGLQSEGRLRMYAPGAGTSTLLTLPTRADHQSSNDGVLGMALDPDFETNRHLYIYYSPRFDPGCDSCIRLGHNVISRFTLNAAGTAVVAGSEQEILRVPKVKVGNDNQDGVANQSTYGAHVGGGSLSFDSEGNLYVGTGDDVDPFGQGSSGYAPLDQRHSERYDARNTSADTSDLRGKILRIRPLPDADGAPGAGTTYAIPAGNMFPAVGAETRPEIYAMGFRNPFTVQADPREPGTVLVADYGPDAGSSSPSTRGPAGIIEWNRVTRPGFYGWPFCAGDNSAANSYFRYQFPSGPVGARFDCSAAQIPNESPHNEGLDTIPGPAIGADVWHKRDGTHPARFGLPVQGSPQEPIAGPLYEYDADNPSDRKWPAYYDGAWLLIERAQNWWREARVAGDGSGIVRTNSLFGTTQFGQPAHRNPIPAKFGPDGSLYVATWSFDCCRRQLGGSQPGQLMRIDYVGDHADVQAPVVDVTVDGVKNAAGHYAGRATLTVDATDSSGVAGIEYSLDGGAEWHPYDKPVAFTETGAYTVQVRATDRATPPNVSEPDQVTFTVAPGESCLPMASDEFEAGTLDLARWPFRHATTPATGADAPGVEAGSLTLPLGAFSVDLARPGPIGFLGQPLPDGDFTLEVQISAPGLDADEGGEGSKYAQVGLKILQTDDNWIKVGQTRNADGGATGSVSTYFEMARETNGTRTIGTRFGLAPAATNLPTWWMRIVRSGNAISAAYSLADPGGPGGAQWVELGQLPDIDTVLPPAAGPRYLGVYGGNGSVTARYAYFRLTPDRPADGAAPVTTLELSKLANDAGWHQEPVGITLSAEDQGECVSGVDRTEHRVGLEWTPYTAPLTVSDDGVHAIEYRSVDVAGNEEAGRSVTVRVDATPPATNARLSPASPGPGGSYTGPVTVALDASDATSDVAATEYRVDGGAWTEYDAGAPPAVSAPGGHTVAFRSRDVAGNVETEGEVAFTIAAPAGEEPPPPPRVGGGDPPPPTTPPPPAGPAARSVELGALPKRLTGARLAKGLRVTGSCEGVGAGTVTLRVSGRNARKLRLGRKAVTLASAGVRCADGRFSAQLRPKRKAKRALRSLRGRIGASLLLRMSGEGAEVGDRVAVRIAGKRAGR